MKLKPELVPYLVKAVVACAALGAWYFLGKPIDETTASDATELLMGLLVGKEFLKHTGAAKP